MTKKLRGPVVSALALFAAVAAGPAMAGSFGEGGFARYVPPVTHPTLNETPFITTEAKPIYIYHDIPDGFAGSDGGTVNVVALQARLAITDRLGFIATTDGYTWIDFDDGPSEDGFNDIAAGLKYAVVSDPAAGTIFSVGARYTAPLGNLDVLGLDLNGTGAGYIDVFASGAQLMDKMQIQGSVGAQVALSGDNWSYIHASLHGDYEVAPGFYPLIEANLIVPIDGGNQLNGVNLTGVEIADLGASDPEATLTIAAGMRLRLSDNVILGAAFEKNLITHDITGDGGEANIFGWRITSDVTIHF